MKYKFIIFTIGFIGFMLINNKLYSEELIFHPTWKVGQEFRLCDWSYTFKTTTTKELNPKKENFVSRASQKIFLFRIEKILKINGEKCYQLYMEPEHYKTQANINCERIWFSTKDFRLIQTYWFKIDGNTGKIQKETGYKRRPRKINQEAPIGSLSYSNIPLEIIPDFSNNNRKGPTNDYDWFQKIEFDKNRGCHKIYFSRSSSGWEQIQYWYPGEPWFRTCELLNSTNDVVGVIDLVTPGWKFEKYYNVEKNQRVTKD